MKCMPYRDPEKNKEKARKWARENPERKRQHGRAWARRNQAQIALKGRRYRAANADKIAARVRRWQLANPERVKEAQRKYYTSGKGMIAYRLREYGLTPKQFELLKQTQRNCCAICSRPFGAGARALRVDHCHSKLAVRGLLCNNCNSGVGLLEDCPILLRRAICYLKKFSGAEPPLNRKKRKKRKKRNGKK